MASTRETLDSLVAAQRVQDSANDPRPDRERSHGNQHAATGRIAHTLTACCRCRTVRVPALLERHKAFNLALNLEDQRRNVANA